MAHGRDIADVLTAALPGRRTTPHASVARAIMPITLMTIAPTGAGMPRAS